MAQTMEQLSQAPNWEVAVQSQAPVT